MGTRRPHTVTHKGPVPLHYYVRGIGSAAPALGEAVAWRGQRRAWCPRNARSPSRKAAPPLSLSMFYANAMGEAAQLPVRPQRPPRS